MKQRNVLLVAPNNETMLRETDSKIYFRLKTSITNFGDLCSIKNILIDDLVLLDDILIEYTTLVVHGTWSDDINTKSEKKIQKAVVDYAFDKSLELIVIETKLLSRVLSVNENILQTYHRVGLNHWLYNRGTFINKPNDNTRFNSLLLKNNVTPKPWKKDGEYVLMILGFERDPSNDINPLEFIKLMSNKLNGYKVKVRMHPLTRKNKEQKKLILEKINYYGFELDEELSFEKSLENVLFCVMYNSTSVFQSVWNGVPCVTNFNNFGYDISIKDISLFNEYSYPDRTEWFNKISWMEFTRQEMGEIDFWQTIKKELLDENINCN